MKKLILALLTTTLFSATISAAPPAITVVCIVDQLAEHLLSRHRPFLTGGIHKMMTNGMHYTQAYHAHGLPATGTGHAGLSTGTYAYQHGIVANEWIHNGKKTKACDDADVARSAVFAPTGTYKKGKSAANLLAPTLSDSATQAAQPITSLALSLKSRAAIPCAGKHGMPIWFDSKGGQFTSSKAFMPHLPGWVNAMNRHLRATLHTQKETQWQAVFAKDHDAYTWVSDEAEQFTGYPFDLVDSPQPIHNGRTPYFLYQQTPQANQDLFRLARLAISMQRRQRPGRPILLWLSLSSLDYVGHYYGPQSKEAIDMVYHVDRQLGAFMNALEREYGSTNCLWALTADHGVMSIPERLQDGDRPTAQRLATTPLLKDLNWALFKTFNVKNLLDTMIGCNLYLNQNKWQKIAIKKQSEVVAFIKKYLGAITGVANVWHAGDFAAPLFNTTHDRLSREQWYKKQYYPGRSGDFIIQVAPYTYMTPYPQGTSHESPYDYDVRVPLMLYGPTRIKHGSYDVRIPVTYLPTTLAQLLEVPRPALAPRYRLPSLRIH